MATRKTLTEQQEEILYYLTKEFLTIRKIALLRRVSVQAVYKIIRKLKAKGFISGTQLRGFKKSTPTTKKPRSSLKKSNNKLIRLHGVSFRIKVLESSKFYELSLEKKNLHNIGNNTIRAFKESLVIHINQEFTHTDEIKATSECFNYINRLLLRLENELGIILVRNKYTELKLLSNHYAEINNEISKEYNKNKIKLDVYSKDDGKLWFQIDNSFNLNEAETLHSQTAFNDIGKVKEYFNDIRDKSEYIFLPSQLTKVMGDMTRSHQNTNIQLEQLVNTQKETMKIIAQLIKNLR